MYWSVPICRIAELNVWLSQNGIANLQLKLIWRRRRMGKRVMVVGGGGREYALLWKLSQSPRIGKLYCAPGNGGTRDIAENVQIGITDITELAKFAGSEKIDIGAKAFSRVGV